MSRLQFLFATCLVLTFVSFSVHGQGLGYGSYCNPTDTCRYQFTCIDGRCECRHPRHQQYESSIDRCVSGLLAPCTEIIDEEIVQIPCIVNAECRNDTGFPECLCRSGTRQSGRSCAAEFGQPCTFNRDCFSPTSFNSNPMICKNQRCDCRDLEVFDEPNGRCVGLVGEICGTGYICVEGATCERFDSFDGICRCTGAFIPTPDRRCGLAQCRGL